MQAQVTRTPAVSYSVSLVKFGTGGTYVGEKCFIAVPGDGTEDQLVERSTKEPTGFGEASRGL